MKLSIDHLTVTRGERAVIDDLTFALEAGQALIVSGANGCGKTTLLRTLVGFIAPSSGHITLSGIAEDDRLHEQCHYVGHTNGIKDALTVAENLSFYAGYLSDSAHHSVDLGSAGAAMNRLSLAGLANVPVGYLSAGQKRRVGLARLLCVERRIWILDEPTAALDQAGTRDLTQIMQDHVDNEGLIIAATHLDLGLSGAQQLRLDRTAGPS